MPALILPLAVGPEVSALDLLGSTKVNGAFARCRAGHKSALSPSLPKMPGIKSLEQGIATSSRKMVLGTLAELADNIPLRSFYSLAVLCLKHACTCR